MQADNRRKAGWPALFAVILCLSPACLAGPDTPGASGYSPYVGRDFPENVYWGDTHLHTNLSADAYALGNSLTPEDAYRFACGATVVTNSGQPVRLSRPLDFLVIADHAEYLGVSALLDEHPEQLANSAMGQRWLRELQEGKRQQILLDNYRASMGESSPPPDPALSRSVWQRVIDAAERANDPGHFTAFIGFEWSSLPGGDNLHRNVIFRDGADRAGAVLPFSALDSRDPEDLWRYLQDYEARTGGRVMAIPHNANMSNGLMFADTTLDGDPLTREYAQARARWEPLLEVTQIKGDGEAHPRLSPEDEFADFETWDEGNFSLPQEPKQDWMLAHEYARPALENGLALERSLGANPFKFGMIGSTDSHIALPAVEENNFFGKFAVDEPSPRRAAPENPMRAYRYAAAGYAAVWARDNTREALFDAMQRREVYATTGPRITLRFFGGWEFAPADAERPDYVAIGYGKGVPMGRDLGPAAGSVAPAFLVAAAKDPEGANLDRVQIVKGWVDADNTPREKVYDVALADGRTVDAATGRAPALASTVDVKSATYTNSVGDAQLAAVWRDPDFDPRQPAFYYVRVLEIPTPRWTTYDAAYYHTPLPAEVPAVIQERAYSSPIWYRPAADLH